MDVKVTVDAPKVPTPVIDGYTQLVLTIIALLLAVIAFTGVMRSVPGNIRSLQDILIFGPNRPPAFNGFDEAPLTSTVKDELQKRILLHRRFMPLGRVFLTSSANKSGAVGEHFIWGLNSTNLWAQAGFVVLENQEDIENGAGLSQADRKQLSEAGVHRVATIEPTEKGKRHACNSERSKTFGRACLEVSLGDFDQLRVVRTEWGKKGIYHYRLILATLEVDPSTALQELNKGTHFWGFECAIILRHDPFRDTWKPVAFNMGEIDDTDLDTAEIMTLWSTMEH